MTLRDDLERLAVALESRLEPGGTDFVAKYLRVLAARCDEAEKPAEPAPAPAQLAGVLEKAKDALRWLLHLHHGVSKGGEEVGIGTAEWTAALADAQAALDALRAYKPEPLPQVVREVVKELREVIDDDGWHEHIADRLAESVPGGAEEGSAAAYKEGWHDGRKALLDHEGIALSGTAASGAGADERLAALWPTFGGVLEEMRWHDDRPGSGPKEGPWVGIALETFHSWLCRLECIFEASGHAPAAPTSSAPPRRCIACNLLNPGSDVCPATESGKHVYEADGEGVDDEPAIATCPEVAELKEVIRAIAKEAAREEVASALARLMKPAPEEHVAPDTSGTRRKP